jgi:PKD repeat protein
MKKIIYLLSCILICVSCKKELVVDFEITGITKVGETVNFINHSGNSYKYFWNFGDGSSSTEENPIHKYSMPGTYTVTLKITDANGSSSSVSKLVKITGTTYSFHNNTSFDLSDFRSFYWNGTDIVDIILHGTLPQGQETNIVITTRPEILFGFRFGDKLFVGTKPFVLIPDMHNLLTIDDNTTIYGGKGANNIFEHLKDQYFLSKNDNHFKIIKTP